MSSRRVGRIVRSGSPRRVSPYPTDAGRRSVSTCANTTKKPLPMRHVLIVDEDHAAGEAMASVAASLGFTCALARSMREAHGQRAAETGPWSSSTSSCRTATACGCLPTPSCWAARSRARDASADLRLVGRSAAAARGGLPEEAGLGKPAARGADAPRAAGRSRPSSTISMRMSRATATSANCGEARPRCGACTSRCRACRAPERPSC